MKPERARSSGEPWPWRALAMPVTAATLAAGILLGRRLTAFWPCLAALLPAAGAAALLPRGRRLIGYAAVVLCLGALLGQTAWHPAVPEPGVYTVTGVVVDEIGTGSRGQYRTRLGGVRLDGVSAPSDAYWSFDAEELPEGLAPGMAVSMTARVYVSGGAENPGGFDFRSWLLARGMRFGVYGMSDLAVTKPDGFRLRGVLAGFRQKVSGRLIASMGEEAGAYASAMLLGTRSLVGAAEREAYSRLGIAHLLAVSGFHVGVLAFLLGRLLSRAPAKLRFGITAGVLALYALLTGMNAPVVRASVLLLLYEYGALRGRQRLSLWLLCASWTIMLVVRPAQLADTGFLLSYGAMAGLTLVTPRLQALLRPKNRVLSALWSGFCAALGAQLGVLLPQLYAFHELPALAVPVNTLLMLVAPAMLSLCWAALAVCWIPAAGPAAGAAAALPVKLLTRAATALSDSGAAVLWTKQAGLLTAAGWALLLAAFALRGKRNGLRLLAGIAGAALTAFSLIPLPHAGTEYLQLSVGSADAAVLWDGDTVTVVDTGSDGLSLADWLHQRRLGIGSLILTHLHSDHAGGVAALLSDRIPVDTVYLPFGAEDASVDEGMTELLDRLEAGGTRLVHLAAGDELPLPSGSLQVLWPPKEGVRPGLNANQSSLAMLATLHGTTLLLTGDLDGRYENYAAVPADLLKAAHHGSASSSGEAFLRAVGPEAVILSCGDTRRPAAFREKLPGVPVWSTEESGAVTVVFTEDGFELKTQSGT